MFSIKFVIIINKIYKTISNNLVSILKVFRQFTINNILKFIIDKNGIKIHLTSSSMIFLTSLFS